MHDPLDALSEMHRVCRPGGRAVFAEPDWAALAIDSARPDISDAFVDFTCATVVRNARIGREIGRMAVDAGWTRLSVTAFIATFTDFADDARLLGLSRDSAEAVRRGCMASDDREVSAHRAVPGNGLVLVTR